MAEYVDLITIAADAQDTVQLTVLGEQQEPKTAANVATMSYEEFAMLYAVSPPAVCDMLLQVFAVLDLTLLARLLTQRPNDGGCSECQV